MVKKSYRAKERVKEKSVKSLIKKLALLFGLAAMLYIIIRGSKVTIENYQLSRYGEAAVGHITGRQRVGSKGTIWTYYEFNLNGMHYSGRTVNESRYQTGDTILVIYKKSDPTVNRSYTLLKESFDVKVVR